MDGLEIARRLARDPQTARELREALNAEAHCMLTAPMDGHQFRIFNVRTRKGRLQVRIVINDRVRWLGPAVGSRITLYTLTPRETTVGL